MTIPDKTRKILWGRSGNRCAFCRKELVVEATRDDKESVVGEECHIVSAAPEGPRRDSTYPLSRIDDPENLILLCRVHHKMVDDQKETYTVEKLKKLKDDHEKWVQSSLNEEKKIPPVRVKRVKENIPSFLLRITTGNELFGIVNGASAFTFEHEEVDSEKEVALIADFLQEIRDYGEISEELEISEMVRAKYRMKELLRELEIAGFWVFGGREKRILEGGIGAPTSFPVAIIEVLHANSQKIVKLENNEKDKQHN